MGLRETSPLRAAFKSQRPHHNRHTPTAKFLVQILATAPSYTHDVDVGVAVGVGVYVGSTEAYFKSPFV
jgi:hypothetical protein